ncbi:hypothetical protein IPC1587_32240 [Pseudomonas aeruginosa]|nr:hypothetical protein IPC1587_32240 [Pseudomonas aeruginosa]
MAWKGEVLANNEAGQVTSLIYNPGDVITIVAAGWASYGPTQKWGHCCKVSDEAAFCLIQRPYISKTLLTRRISPRGSP